MNAEHLKSLPSLLNRYLCTAALAGSIGYAAFNIDPIANYLADRLGSLHELKVAGAALTFDAQNIDADKRLFDIKDLTRETSGKIAGDIRKLNAPLMERLIFVESLKGLCKYDTQDWQAEQAAALDDHLAALGLATIENDAEAKDRIDWRIRTHDKYAPGKELGAPLRCYKVTLTAEGANVRNVLVSKMVQEATRRAPEEPASQPSNVEPPASALAPTHAATTAKPARVGGPRIAMRQH